MTFMLPYNILDLIEKDETLSTCQIFNAEVCYGNGLQYNTDKCSASVQAEVEDFLLCNNMTNTAGYFMDFEKEEILEKFARGDKARSTEGNGLGLAIVSSYAKALGGEFDIQIDCDQFKAFVVLPRE